jgi:excinuclease ABC subunit B
LLRVSPAPVLPPPAAARRVAYNLQHKITPIGVTKRIKDMIGHARNLELEKAAQLRDQLAALKKRIFGVELHAQ